MKGVIATAFVPEGIDPNRSPPQHRWFGTFLFAMTHMFWCGAAAHVPGTAKIQNTGHGPKPLPSTAGAVMNFQIRGHDTFAK
jgi:hypothetical protein